MQDKEFLQILDNEKFHCEDVYLEEIVKPELRKSHLQTFYELIDVYLKNPEVLVSIGNRAWGVGRYSVEIAEYMKVSIKACGQALKDFTLKKNPEKYAMTQINLGTAYKTLGEVEEKVTNCEKAIKAYNEALKIFSRLGFVDTCAFVRHNLGKCIQFQARLEDKDACKIN